jgi:hypothetical protein
MKNIIKIAIIILILLAIASVTYTSLTGQVVSDKYNYTKAICNENNFCQDYIVTCEGNNLIELSPITGAVIQHSSNWSDPRGEQTNNYCD